MFTMAPAVPDLHVPPSRSTVNVSIIDCTVQLCGAPTARFLEPAIEGHEWLGAPCYSFLVQHPGLGRSLVFDLGIRKDWRNLSPAMVRRVTAAGFRPRIEKNVREILNEHGVDTSAAALEAVIWSHAHFDHTGDPSTFDTGTALIVGPGIKAALLPGYPANPEAMLLESDFAGREVRELSFEGSELRIGQFPALDYFGDGSFYLLDAPGHALGHVCGFARVTSDPDSFVFMGGDACHHGGEWRPSQWIPLPDYISPNPFTGRPVPACPGAMFEKLLPGSDTTQPFYGPAENSVHADVPLARQTIGKLQEADNLAGNVLVVVAHDESLLDVLDFFPERANDFVWKGWVEKGRWRFLKDFGKPVGYEGEVTGLRDWSGKG